jgi:hypothetical protein
MTNDSNPDFDDEFHELLGFPDHSGYGFGLRDLQWMEHVSNQTPEQILQSVKEIAGGHLAYITVSQDDQTILIQYEAAWFQQNPADPVPPTQGH